MRVASCHVPALASEVARPTGRPTPTAAAPTGVLAFGSGMGKAMKVLTAVILFVPLAYFCFMIGLYNWDMYQAGRAMRMHTDAIAIGDSLDDIGSMVERADAEAGNQPFGSYLLGQTNNILSQPRAQDSNWVVRGFWLRTGVTCYLELAVHEQVVIGVEDVYCVNDGWLE